MPKRKVLENTGVKGRAGSSGPTESVPAYEKAARKERGRGTKRLPAKPLPRSMHAEAYIEQYRPVAISEMENYGIPASITLAQGLLESANGNSELAVYANNHFGIKATSDWKGKTILKDDDRIDDVFRSYQSADESFRDHSEFLLRKRYAALFDLDKDDYKGWAHGLKQAGYATNPRYAYLLIDLVERYELHQYDRSENKVEKIVREEKVFKEIEEQQEKEVVIAEAKPPVKMDIHTVASGDTVYNICKRYGLSAEELRTLNSLSGDRLTPGQLLLVSK